MVYLEKHRSGGHIAFSLSAIVNFLNNQKNGLLFAENCPLLYMRDKFSARATFNDYPDYIVMRVRFGVLQELQL
jgi:hypothetical protein